MTLAEIIFTSNKPYQNFIRGAAIHKISLGMAERMASIISSQSSKLGISDHLSYLLAVIMQESRFDPEAYNKNLHPFLGIITLGQLKAFDNGDWGCAMFKGKYIKVAKDCPELFNLPEYIIIKDFLFNPSWAVPKMVSRYANLLKIGGGFNLDSKWVASGMYKAGVRGFREAYINQSGDSWKATNLHIQRVQQHFDAFQKLLG